jgi:signal transduction histidine kinase/ActR/RegA family two-component response regulator
MEICRTTGDGAGNAVFIFDADDATVYLNWLMTGIIGYDEGELVALFGDVLRGGADNRRTSVIGSGGTVDSLPRSLQATLNNRRGRKLTLEITRADSSWQGRPRSLAVVRDITSYLAVRREVEAELIRSARLESLATLAGGIAHDFNNLLTGILGNIALASTIGEPNGEVAERLREAEDASLRARDLTQQLMSFTRGVEPQVELSSIADIITDAASFASHGAVSGCKCAVSDNLWMASVDTGQIHQVISNLVINAHEAMADGGVIAISAENKTINGQDRLPLENGDYVVVSVSDTGGGIPEENLVKIFDPYFSTKSGGFGLGLANSYFIVRNHRGHISVASQPGQGTTFCLYLPAVRGAVSKAGVAPVSSCVCRQGNILVMDDEEIIRKLLMHMLEDTGYRATAVCHGGEAVQAYREAQTERRPFDAVILDLTISGAIGGKETIRQLLEIDPSVCAIVSSGYSDDPVMANYAAYGFRDVITKPYTLTELGSALDRVLEAKP